MTDKPEQTKLPLKLFVAQAGVQKKLAELLGSRAGKFATSLVAIQRGNVQLQRCSPESILGAAMSAAALNLEIDPNLGEAHLVPYGEMCSLQIGYKGLTQLALRSGQYKRLGWAIVYEGELEGYDTLEGEFRYNPALRKSDVIIGYAAKFTLINGFERAVFWTKDTCHAHGKRFSKSYGKKNKYGDDVSPWQTNPDAMCLKSVLKDLLSHWGPRSIEMRDALSLDTKVFRDDKPENALTEGEAMEVETVPASEDASVAKEKPADPGAPTLTPAQEELIRVTEGCSFDDFRTFYKVQKNLDLEFGSMSEIPNSLCEEILKDAKNLGKFVTVYAKKKG